VRVAQDGKLPLHYAAEKAATLEVVRLLLGAESNVTATAEDEARRRANTTAPRAQSLFELKTPCTAPTLCIAPWAHALPLPTLAVLDAFAEALPRLCAFSCA